MEAALESEVVIHTALEHSPRGPQQDRELLDRLLPALSDTGSARTFIYTSGNFVIGPAPEPVDESVTPAPVQLSAWRAPLEQRVLEAMTLSLRTAVVRPGIVYGGSRGIVADLLKDALNGLVRVIGPGTNHWPCVYDRDLGELYARIVEAPEASGVYHVNDEGDEQVNAIVEAIAEHVSPRPDIRHVPIAEARTKMGTYADALALDQRLRQPARPRDRLGADVEERVGQRRPTARGISEREGLSEGVQGAVAILVNRPIGMRHQRSPIAP